MMRQTHANPAVAASLLATLTLSMTSVTTAAEICTRPQPPSIPSGANAELDLMRTVRTDVDAYLDRMQAYIDCLARENTDAAADAERVVELWNAALQNFENKP